MHSPRPRGDAQPSGLLPPSTGFLRCGAVTCNGGAAKCTVRASHVLSPSPSPAEVSYVGSRGCFGAEDTSLLPPDPSTMEPDPGLWQPVHAVSIRVCVCRSACRTAQLPFLCSLNRRFACVGGGVGSRPRASGDSIDVCQSLWLRAVASMAPSCDAMRRSYAVRRGGMPHAACNDVPWHEASLVLLRAAQGTATGVACFH